MMSAKMMSGSGSAMMSGSGFGFGSGSFSNEGPPQGEEGEGPPTEAPTEAPAEEAPTEAPTEMPTEEPEQSDDKDTTAPPQLQSGEESEGTPAIPEGWHFTTEAPAEAPTEAPTEEASTTECANCGYRTEGEFAAAKKSVSCGTDMNVKITVGTKSSAISPKTGLADGAYSSVQCEEVDPSRRGMIWLQCVEGDLNVAINQCYAPGQKVEVPDAADVGTCAEEKDKLEKTYVKTYVELSRLKAEYSELANSTACDDTVKAEYDLRKAPIQEDIDDLIKAIDKKVKDLQRLRPRLQDALDSESALRQQIRELTEEMEALPETVSDLDKVRDAIHALSECPGLSRVQFEVPKWIGKWVTFEQDAAEMTDEQQDAAMKAACEKAATGSRPAEVGEIAEQTVDGMPEDNHAEEPLIGVCPGCVGDEGDKFKSGHARVCWNQGEELLPEGKNTACATGLKAIMCVMDRPNFRNIPGE